MSGPLEDVIFTKDLEGRYTGMNPSGLRSLGAPREEDVLGKRAGDFFPPAVAEAMEAADAEVLRTGSARRDRMILNWEGRPVTFEILRLPRRDAAGRVIGVIGVSHDVTEDVVAGRQLREVSRVECQARLAGRVARELRTLAEETATRAEALSVAGTTKGEAEAVRRALARLGDLAGRLAAFGETIRPAIRRLSLNDVANDVVRSLLPGRGHAVQCRLELATDLGLIDGDADQWRAALAELCANALESMPHGGELRIVTENREADAELRRACPTLSAGPCVHLAVMDTGEGLPRSLHERIFEPMFTTRDPAKHWGLGLAVVNAVAVNHGGAVLLEGAPGGGSVFHVYAPRVRGG